MLSYFRHDNGAVFVVLPLIHLNFRGLLTPFSRGAQSLFTGTHRDALARGIKNGTSLQGLCSALWICSTGESRLVLSG